jgi:hypothetical protein
MDGQKLDSQISSSCIYKTEGTVMSHLCVGMGVGTRQVVDLYDECSINSTDINER